MSVDDVVEYFGSLYKASQRLGVTAQAAAAWRRFGYVPMLQQYRIAELTEGELMPDLVNPTIVKREKMKNQEV